MFTLAKGTYQLHARGVGAEKVGSKLLAGLKLSFEQLEAQAGRAASKTPARLVRIFRKAMAAKRRKRGKKGGPILRLFAANSTLIRLRNSPLTTSVLEAW